MGTNYYLVTDTCPHCQRGDEKLHIGKSSSGWVFSLHVIPGEIESLEDWVAKILNSGEQSHVQDEYGEIIPFEGLISVIVNRSGRPDYACDPHFMAQNHAAPGPNNLYRHKLGNYCIGHGSGTWDLMTGQFS